MIEIALAFALAFGASFDEPGYEHELEGVHRTKLDSPTYADRYFWACYWTHRGEGKSTWYGMVLFTCRGRKCVHLSDGATFARHDPGICELALSKKR